MPSNAKKLARMARRKKMGATDTETILLVGGGLLLVFLMMKPKTPTYPPVVTAPGGALPQPQGTSSTNTAITAGASVVNNLINQIFG